MRAAVLRAHDLSGLSLTDVDVPTPGPGEVLVRVDTVGVNQLDLNVIRGVGPGSAAQLPRVLGIDPAGMIVAVGDDVPGDRVGEGVVVKPNIPCGACAWCRARNEADCSAQTVVGVHRDGGAAEFVVVPADSAFPRGALSAEQATAAIHSVPIALNALDTIDVGGGDRLLITGAGGALGRAAAALAAHRGAQVTTASRRAPRDSTDRAIVAPDAEQLARRLAEEGHEFDAVVDVSGHAPTLSAAIGSLAWAGRAVFCAASIDTSLVIDARRFYLHRLTLRGAASASYRQVRRALQLVADGVVPDLIGAHVEFDDLIQAYRDYPLPVGGKVIVHVR